MNICMVVYGFYEFDHRIQKMAICLKEKGFSVEVISLKWKNDENFNIYNGIKVHKILGRNFKESKPIHYFLEHILFFIRASFKVTQLYFREKYDCIQIHNIPDFLVFTTLLPKLFGAKIILDIRDIVPEFAIEKFSLRADHLFVKVLKVIENISASYAHHVITVTEIWKERLVGRGICESKCSVIENVPNLKLFYPHRLTENNKSNFLIVYHGNLSEQNGLDILINRVGIIKNSIPSVMLTIIGDLRKNNNIKELIRKLDLTKYINIHSSVPHGSIPELLSNADIGIEPKKDGVYSGETLSVKAMEYMAMGIPVIVSRTKASCLYFNDSMVEYFEAENEVDLAKKIVKLYKSPQRRQELVIASNKYLEDYNWDKHGQKYHAIVRDILTRK